MRELVEHEIKLAKRHGEKIGTARYRNELPYVVAKTLEREEVGEWKHMELWHLRSKDYRMFKSLMDLCNSELKRIIKEIEK